MDPAVASYLETEEDGFAPLLVTVPEVGMTEVVHLAAWCAHHRTVATALETPSDSPSRGRKVLPNRGGRVGKRVCLSFEYRVPFVLLPRAFQGMTA